MPVLRLLAHLAIVWVLLAGDAARAQYPAWTSLDHSALGTGNVVRSNTSVAATQGGSVFVATAFANQFGGRTSWRVAKYAAATGALQWQAFHTASLQDEPYAVAVDPQGDVVVTGASGDHSIRGLLTVKFRGSDGATLWVAPAYPELLVGRAVRVDAAGNVIVQAVTEAYPSTGRTFKYAGANGQLLWERDSSGCVTIALDGAGNVIGGGAKQANNFSNLYVAKYRAADGTLAWERLWTAPSGESVDFWEVVAVDGAGDAYVASGLGSFAMQTIKVAGTDGHVIWNRATDTSTISGFPAAIALDASGNVVVAGSWGRTVKYAGATGAVQWDRKYASTSSATLTSAMGVDAGGGVLHTGLDWNSGMAFIIKLSAGNGATAWTSTRAGTEGNALVMADGQDPVVAATDQVATTKDLALLRYDGGSGALTWNATRPIGPGEAVAGSAVQYGYHAAANAGSLIVDAAGSAIVAGYEYNGYGTSLRIVKRAALDGSTLWSRSIDYGPDVLARASAVALDRSGNAVVAGTVTRPGFPGSADWRVVKLSVLDGTILWDRPVASGSGFGQPYAIAVDAAGNAFVAGSATADGNLDFQTVKLAAADGATLWTRSYAGPGYTDEAMAVAVDSQGDVVVAGDVGFAVFKMTQVIKYRNADGFVMWSVSVDGSIGDGGGMGIDPTGSVTVAGVFGNTLALGVSRLAGSDGHEIWRRDTGFLGAFEGSVLALDSAGNAYTFATRPTGLRAQKLAAATGAPLWDTLVWPTGFCRLATTAAAVDGFDNAYFAAEVGEPPTAAGCVDPKSSQHVFKLQGSTGAVLADHVAAPGDTLYAIAPFGESVYLAGSGAVPHAVGGMRVVKLTSTPQTSAPGTGTVSVNPYGPLTVQGATLNGNQITQWQPNAVIDLGSTPGTPGSFAQIDFAGFGVPAGGTLTIRAHAANQSVIIDNLDTTASVIGGTLRVQGAGGAPAPDLYVHNRKGISIYSSGVVDAPRGLVLDALAGTAESGSKIVNEGRVDGGPSLSLFAAGVNGGGLFAGNAVTLSSFGNANNPANGAFFLDNGLRFAPSSGSAVAFNANLYGDARKIFNVMIEGNTTFAMPSAWPPGSILPRNDAVIMPGETRPANVPDPAYGGGSMIVQASGSLTLASGTGDFVFPGGIVLKAGTSIDFNGVFVDQGWTTSGQAFQGLFFEAPAIGNSKGLIQIYGNDLNWANFSTFPSAFVRSFTLQRNANGSASHLPADAVAPHLNTYSLLIDAAARGQCWTCLQNTQPTNMFGP